jgi:L-rhamnose mutarotase
MTIYRQAWRMRLRPGGEAAYDTAHADIWPEMIAQMRASGVSTFVIYRDGREVFAYQERGTPFAEAGSAASETLLRWWRTMEPLMVTDLDGRPMRRVMDKVFVLQEVGEAI